MKKSFYLGILSIFLFSCTVNVPFEKCAGNKEIAIENNFVQSNLDFVNTNTASPEEIEEQFGYRGKNNTYIPEVYYYSANWDTLFVAYKNIANITELSTNLSQMHLIELEEYILNNFQSYNYLEYGEFLKIIRIYPDAKDVSCNSDSLGCTSNQPQNTNIDLYKVSASNLYHATSSREAVIHTLAHEYGHLFNFFNLQKEGDVNAEEYLKIRLGSQYKKIYPKELPVGFIGYDEYYTFPSEILADDYVELFCNLENNFTRLSLSNHKDLQYLKDLPEVKEKLLELYSKVLNRKIAKFDVPILIENNCNSCTINYFDSATFTSQKKITSKHKVYLIANSAVENDGIWYYRVILSSFIEYNKNFINEIGSKMGYVEAKYFKEVTNAQVYKLNNNEEIVDNFCEFSDICRANKVLPIYIDNGYPFSYFINIYFENDKMNTYDYFYSKKYNAVSIEFNKFTLITR